MTDTLQAGSETSALTTDSAVDVFKALLDSPREEAQAEEAPEPEKEQEAAEAEPEVEAEESAEADEADDSPITIEVDGKKVELSKAELAEYYKNGLRQKDYTQKTMEVSEQRKAAEAERQAALQERQAYAQNLQKMAMQLEGALEEQAKIDWDSLIQSDPVEYLKQQALVQKRQAALQQNLQQLGQIDAMNKAEQQKAYVQYIEEQSKFLLDKVPEWKDAKKASEDKAALRSYLLEFGYDKQSVESVADAKAVALAHKAMKYDQMMAKASAAAKKVATLPTKVERPGNGRTAVDQRSSAFQRLAKSGKVEDAAAVFRSIL